MTRYVDFPTATGDIVFSGSPSGQRCRRLLASEALAAFKKRQNSLIPVLIEKKMLSLLAPAFDGWLQKTLKSRENTEQGGMIVLKVGFQNLTYDRRVSDVN